MQKSRKKFWIVFTSIIASLVLVGLVCGLVTRVKTVTVEFRARASAGYTMLEDGVLDKVAKAGEFDTKKSLLFMNFEENIAKIEKSNPYIKVEQVVRHFPNIVKVYVSERIPRYRVADKDDSNKWYILDVDFKVIDVVIGGEAAVKEQNYGRSSSFYDATIKIESEDLAISTYVGDFVSNNELKTQLNAISSGMIVALGDIKLAKSVDTVGSKFIITMKNSGINNDDGCQIELEGTDDLAMKAKAGALAYANANDSDASVDLSGKIITISKDGGTYVGLMRDKETA
jgi:hypothetical protein